MPLLVAKTLQVHANLIFAATRKSPCWCTRFYDKVRADSVLGPIFNSHIHDWDHHLARLVDFWSSILRGAGRFTGAPMPKHIALPGLTAGLFQRWLALFHDTTSAQDLRVRDACFSVGSVLWWLSCCGPKACFAGTEDE